MRESGRRCRVRYETPLHLPQAAQQQSQRRMSPYRSTGRRMSTRRSAPSPVRVTSASLHPHNLFAHCPSLLSPHQMVTWHFAAPVPQYPCPSRPAHVPPQRAHPGHPHTRQFQRERVLAKLERASIVHGKPQHCIHSIWQPRHMSTARPRAAKTTATSITGETAPHTSDARSPASHIQHGMNRRSRGSSEPPSRLQPAPSPPACDLPSNQ